MVGKVSEELLVMGGWNKGQKNGVVGKCEYCGKEFYSYPYRKTVAKYCSSECYHKATIKTETRHCENCGALIVITSKHKNKRFCNNACASEYRRKSLRIPTTQKNGYKRVWFSDGSSELEHRYLMEKLLGRKLTKDEVVHHIDGDRSNNSIDNLMLMTRGEHSRLHRNLEYMQGKELFHANKQ